MPLPRNGTAWPPHDSHTEQVAEWSAWYSGDPRALATHYGPRNGAAPRPNQLRGGVVGAVARWWWGVPTPAGESSAKLHVPLAADICGTSADLLFSEQVKLSSESDTLTEFLAALQDAGLDAKLHESAEVQAALGGVYLRTVWDSTVSPLPWTEAAHPDGVVPTFMHGRLRAADLWTELGSEDRSVWRLIERHEPGTITYGLYEGTGSNLGDIRPLADHPKTTHLADLVDENGAQQTGTMRLTVTYVPNMLPNRLHRTSPQGRSDLQGVTPLLDALDEAYSSWWRDIRHAKSRLHVPAQYLENTGPGQGAMTDVDREVYVPVQGVLATGGTGLLIDAQQFAIRFAEHQATCEDWTKRIIESAGYSTQSLSSDSGGAVTAAEVHSHERRSYMTRGKKVRYWRAGLRDHLLTLAEVANAQLGGRLEVANVQVEFQDGVQESALTVATTAQALKNAAAASTETLVRMVQHDWTDDQVAAEVARIHSESGAPLADPLPGMGLPPDAGL